MEIPDLKIKTGGSFSVFHCFLTTLGRKNIKVSLYINNNISSYMKTLSNETYIYGSEISSGDVLYVSINTEMLIVNKTSLQSTSRV